LRAPAAGRDAADCYDTSKNCFDDCASGVAVSDFACGPLGEDGVDAGGPQSGDAL
jgi:hypothetical protein